MWLKIVHIRPESPDDIKEVIEEIPNEAAGVERGEECLDVCEVPGWLCGFLREVDYGAESIRRVLGEQGTGSALDVIDAEFRSSADESQVGMVVRLFCLGEAFEVGAIAERLGTGFDVASLLRFGLLEEDGVRVRSRFKLAPFEDLYVLADFGFERHLALPEDFVMGVGAASRTLLSLVPREEVGSTLDLGTGCGVLAMVASTFSGGVTATDISRRALGLAAANIALNGCENVRFEQGSLFEPVGGKRFDLVVANLPFVISPESSFEFRDGGAGGDELCEEVVRSVADHLVDGGVGVLLLNWCHETDDDWNVRLLEWLGEQPVDAWIIRHQTADPVGYASIWLRMMGALDGEEYRRSVGRWTEHYEKLGINRLSAGALVVRKNPRGRGWTRTDTIKDGSQWRALSGDVRALLAVETLLAECASDDLLALRPRLSGDHVVDQALRFEGGSWKIGSMVLSRRSGFAAKGQLDTGLFQLLSLCDGERTIADIIATAERSAGEGTDLSYGVCEVFKSMLRSGLLVVDMPEVTEA